MGYTARLAAYL